MPRAKKRCGTRGCDQFFPCPVHTRKPWGDSNRRVELPPDWYSFRKPKVLERDPDCRLQLDGCTGTSTEVDHIGDKHDHRLIMLRGVCSSCHAQRTARQGHAARRRLTLALKLTRQG